LNPAGIYIHIPFCRSRCSYCDFATGLYERAAAQRYVEALTREISSWKADYAVGVADTIYFGGGTPSLLSREQLKLIIDALHQRFDFASDVEVTIEMNPGTVTPSKLHDFRRLGVNRASFGAQTFDDSELAKLGRSHTTEETFRTFRELRTAGFHNVSFDLIAGLPGQTLAGWRHNLEQAFALRPEHLSFYLLEVHEGTPLAAHIKRGLQPEPDEDLAAEMYREMLDRADTEGYVHYEISNLSKPGFESRHNTKYWTGAPYYGFGCSAHSYDGALCRWANERDPLSYVQKIEACEPVIVETTELTEDDRAAEAVFLGLRMMNGLQLSSFEKKFGVDLRIAHQADLNRFLDAGLIDYMDDSLKLTRAGALLSNEVFAAFVNTPTRQPS